MSKGCNTAEGRSAVALHRSGLIKRLIHGNLSKVGERGQNGGGGGGGRGEHRLSIGGETRIGVVRSRDAEVERLSMALFLCLTILGFLPNPQGGKPFCAHPFFLLQILQFSLERSTGDVEETAGSQRVSGYCSDLTVRSPAHRQVIATLGKHVCA